MRYANRSFLSILFFRYISTDCSLATSVGLISGESLHLMDADIVAVNSAIKFSNCYTHQDNVTNDPIRNISVYDRMRDRIYSNGQSQNGHNAW